MGWSMSGCSSGSLVLAPASASFFFFFLLLVDSSSAVSKIHLSTAKSGGGVSSPHMVTSSCRSSFITRLRAFSTAGVGVIVVEGEGLGGVALVLVLAIVVAVVGLDGRSKAAHASAPIQIFRLPWPKLICRTLTGFDLAAVTEVCSLRLSFGRILCL